MIHPDLASRLRKLREYNKKRSEAELKFRRADAGKKPFFAQLLMSQDGSSVAEREHKVYATEEWQNYIDALAHAETDFNYWNLEFQIQMNAYYGELAALKQAFPAGDLQ